MTKSHDDWWTRAARVLAGEASPRERRQHKRDAEMNREVRERLSSALEAWRMSDAAPTDWDTERALSTVLRRARAVGPRPRALARPVRHSYRRMVTASAALLMISGGLWTWIARRAPAIAARRYAAAPGVRAEIHLADGSSVVLSPGSALVVAADFGQKARDVTVSGDAYFDVRHDRRRPFVVHALRTVTRVTGTKFVVATCANALECPVRVIVREGTVVVRDTVAPRDSVVLTRGELADAGVAGPIRVARADTTTLLSWIDGRLAFSREPFGRAVARFARWYGVEARLSDTVLSPRLVTASFAATDARTAARLLALLVDARPQWSADTVLFIPLSSRAGSKR